MFDHYFHDNLGKREIYDQTSKIIFQASRFMPRRDVDLCTLDILAIYGEDNGEYACHARSDFGETQTACNVGFDMFDRLQLVR